MSDLVESPIETDMLMAMKHVCWLPYEIVERVSHSDLWNIAMSSEDTKTVFIAPQHKFGRWRADFMLAAYCTGLYPKFVCVECDGHDFHKATAQQKSRDKDRDRQFAVNRIETLRFSGKMIKRDPFKCAKKALESVTGDAAPNEFRNIGELLLQAMTGDRA